MNLVMGFVSEDMIRSGGVPLALRGLAHCWVMNGILYFFLRVMFLSWAVVSLDILWIYWVL